MKRVYGAVVALVTLGLMFGLGMAAQGQKKEPDPAHQHAPAAAAKTPGLWMLAYQQRHAGLATQWTATTDGVFVLRPDQLLKYDSDLKLVKAVTLPEIALPMQMQRPSETTEGTEHLAHKAMGMGRMAQWMAQMHNELPARLEVTAGSVFISRGNHLLRFSHDLELQKNVALPDAKANTCPMCGQMMKHSMPGGHDVH